MKYYLLLLFLVGCVSKEKSIDATGVYNGDSRIWEEIANMRKRQINEASKDTIPDSSFVVIEGKLMPEILYLTNTYWEFSLADSMGVVASKINGKWEIIDCERALNVSEQTFKDQSEESRKLQDEIDSLEKEIWYMKRNGHSLYSKN